MITFKKIIKFLIFLPLILLSNQACASQKQLHVNNEPITLNSETCNLHFNHTEIKLALKKNCFFILNSNSKDIRVEYYKDINSFVLLVVGSSIKNNPDFPLTKTRRDCGSQLQAIKITKNNKISLSKVTSNSITCAGIGVDEKEYWIMAH